MKLNATALGMAASVLWGGVILLVGLVNLIWAGYGAGFLDMVASIYPGYSPAAGIGALIIGTIYGLIDGFIGGVIFAWLYNFFLQKFPA